jgi:hypothetical protein
MSTHTPGFDKEIHLGPLASRYLDIDVLLVLLPAQAYPIMSMLVLSKAGCWRGAWSMRRENVEQGSLYGDLQAIDTQRMRQKVHLCWVFFKSRINFLISAKA